MSSHQIDSHFTITRTDRHSKINTSGILLKSLTMLNMHDNQPILRPVAWRCRELVPAKVGLYRTRCETNNDWADASCTLCKKKRDVGAQAMARNGGCFKVGELVDIDTTGKEIWDYTTHKIICP